MSRGRRLVEALAAAAVRYSPEDQKQKCELLESLERCAIRHPGTLVRLPHAASCLPACVAARCWRAPAGDGGAGWRGSGSPRGGSTTPGSAALRSTIRSATRWPGG